MASFEGCARITIGGLQTVSRKKLRELNADAHMELARTDELELLYLQMFSLRNFTSVKDKTIDRLKEDRLASGEKKETPAMAA